MAHQKTGDGCPKEGFGSRTMPLALKNDCAQGDGSASKNICQLFCTFFEHFSINFEHNSEASQLEADILCPVL